MKNKEPKKKWTGKKQIWYGAAGLFCLGGSCAGTDTGKLELGRRLESQGGLQHLTIFKYRETPIWLHRYPSC